MKSMITCECGKFFEKHQSYAAHKSHCGKSNDPKYIEKKEKIAKKRSEYGKAKYDLWLNQERICEKCKIKFTLKECKLTTGSGRFCSRNCANGRIKHGRYCRSAYKPKIKSCKVYFYFCKNCKKAKSSRDKRRQYCNKHCQSFGAINNPLTISQIRKKCYINGKKVSGGTTKWYEYTNIEGITFKVQGTFELRTCKLLDNWKLSNKILDWEYTKDRIKYVGIDKKYHMYLFDFKVIENDKKFYYIETKGYKTEIDDLKWQATKEQNIDLKIWFLKDIIEQENNGYWDCMGGR